MQRYKVLLAYDGSAYHGWQKQINGISIQETIENALRKIHKQETPITGSGRTDAGVHALGQVFHFDGPGSIDPNGYMQALNTLLPKDIRVLSVTEVPDAFHARFSARKKRYEYILTRNRDNPFTYRYKTAVRQDIDVSRMREASRVFLGEHDFTSFTHAKLPENKPRTKKITRIDILEEGDDIRMVFEADGFLRYQVRMMSAVIIRAGEGKLAADEISRMLESRNKEAVRFNAPAQGLYLVHVEYEHEVPEQIQADCEQDRSENEVTD